MKLTVRNSYQIILLEERRISENAGPGAGAARSVADGVVPQGHVLCRR